MPIIIEQLLLGPMDNYTYLVGDTHTKEIVIIDPGWDFPTIKKTINKLHYIPKAVILTHGHFDHINESAFIQKELDIPIYLSKEENIQGIHQGLFVSPPDCQFSYISDGDTFQIGQVQFKIISTPGHTPGGVCILVENRYLFTGDTLFLDGCGRWDLPLAAKETLINSIRQKIVPLPDDVIIYPGHDYHPLKSDTLGRQKLHNTVLKNG